MKKKIALLLAFLLFSLTGCSKLEELQNVDSLDELESFVNGFAEMDSDELLNELFETTTTSSSPSTEDATDNDWDETVTEPITEESTTTEAPTTTEVPTATEVPTTTVAPTTTPEPTTPAPTEEATTAVYWVDNGSESSTTTSDYKYGLKKIVTVTNYYDLYSDGSKNIYYTDESVSYNTDGYNASDAQLLEESNSKSATNITYYNEVLTLVNQIRAEAGVAPLTLDTTMCQAATMRAVEMNYSTIFSHTRPDGSSCFSVFSTYNISYGWAGENIAAGYGTPASVVEGWKNSEGHYANMINTNFTRLGVGMSNENLGYGIYWVQLFSS